MASSKIQVARYDFKIPQPAQDIRFTYPVGNFFVKAAGFVVSVTSCIYVSKIVLKLGES